MKQFLKSTAIFACMAFLFCACGDDGTDDAVVSTSSSVSSFKLLQAGEERAWVKWTVPSSDNIASCQISWTGKVSGSIKIESTEGIMEAKIGETFTNIINGEYTLLPEGTYTFTVKSLTSSGLVLGEDSAELYIYDQSTYTERPEISAIVLDEAGAWITWGNIPQDCIGVNITYWDTTNYSVDMRVESDLIPIIEGVPINIAAATANTAFTFETHFKPNEGETNEGLDVIILENDDDEEYIFPALMPTTACSVSALPGENRFIVYWNVPLVADITSSYVEYTNTAGEIAKVEIKGSDLLKGLTEDKQNSCEFRNLPAGDYTVTIYNVNIATEISEPESTTVTVYDDSTYKVGAKIKQDITLNSAGEAEVAWDYSEVSAEALVDCWGVIATAGTEVSAEEKELVYSEPNAWSYIADAKGQDVSYVTYFKPENGLDKITVEIDDDDLKSVATTASPDKPEDVVFYAGNYALFLEFNLTTDASISKVRIEYTNTDEDEAANSKIVDFEKGNFSLGRDNFISIGMNDDLKLNYEYDLKIWTETSSGTRSAYESVNALKVYDLSEFQSECEMPTFTYEFGVAYPYGVEMNWTDTGCEYVDFTYVYNTDSLTKTERIYDLSNPTILADVMPGNNYSWKATFSPAPNAMDTYSISRTSSSAFPYVRVDKSLITEYTGMLSAAERADGDVTYNNFSNIIDNVVSASEDNSDDDEKDIDVLATVGKYLTASGQAEKTLTYDLGATYKLAEFYYTPYMGYIVDGFEGTTSKYNCTITEFSLYGTNTEDPANNGGYNALAKDGTQDWDEWECLLDHQTVPDLNDELYSTLYDLYDYNDDGVVDGTDMTWAVLNGGFRFEIPDSLRVPVRYISIQFHEAANCDATEEADYQDRFVIIEIDHTHMGCEVE